MDAPFQQTEPVWQSTGQNLTHVLTREVSPNSSADRRRSSSGSVSTGDSTESAGGTRGRRTRPSVTTASSQLPTVLEKNAYASVSSEEASTRPPTIKVSSHEKVVSSKKVLTSFNKVASRNAEKEETRRQQIYRIGEENTAQRAVYKRLAKWADTAYEGTREYLLSWAIPSYRQTLLPDAEELKSLARHYYLPRSEVKCHVCDFGVGRAEHTVVDLGQLEEYLIVKPDWVDVRWIHAPLGLGLTHSSVEDIFLHEGEAGREFENAGRGGWPYLETEVLNFRHRENFQEMRDVYLLLHQREELFDDLNKSTWKADRNASLHHDIDWRADHMATNPDFWTLVGSDMPWQLTEGLAMGSLGPKDGLLPIKRHVDRQMLSSHPFFRDSQLVRDPFRAFHRGDGFLLTLSPMAGINYLDKNFSRYLAEPIEASFDNDDASAIGHSFQAFAESGTSGWHRPTVEWFLIYLVTEVGVTPHPIRQGYNAPSFESAYSSIIQDLKRRRYEEWKPKVTVQLVREYLSCIDEITTIKLILQRNAELFRVLQLDIKKFEETDTYLKKPINPEGESSAERLAWATKMVQTQHDCFERLLIDLKQSMEALFQLRTIEQSEMAIVSESHNKAIFLFTGVTIVFLPLSFFTSYFGMNLAGIANTTLNERYFWEVCGTVAFLIVLVVALGAFQHNLRGMLRRRIGKTQGAMV